tara:strand:+ start:3209 stop:3610 length:402 start_codon:yes stop_codon:yes gene_type:complete
MKIDKPQIKSQEDNLQSMMVDILEPKINQLNHLNELDIQGIMMGMCKVKLVNEETGSEFNFHNEEYNFSYLYADTLSFLDIKNKKWLPNLFFDFCSIDNCYIDEIFIEGFKRFGYNILDSKNAEVKTLGTLLD